MLADARLQTLPRWQVYVGMGGRIQRNIHFTGKEARLTLGRVLGYNVEKSNFAQKLDQQRRRYDAMERRIPQVYLETIGVKWDEFETCLEADAELFREETAKPRYPRYAMVRLGPVFYKRVTFPEGTPESRAIAILGEGDTAHFLRMIAYPELLIIFIGRGKETEPVYGWYPPELRFGPKDIMIQKLPRGMGRARIL